MSRRMRVAISFAVLFAVLFAWTAAAERLRTEVNFPDIEGYTTLKCDFHMHTAFSDGHVWPNVRVWEAWRTGLDAIAITDHLEYLPRADDLGRNRNRPHEIALPEAETPPVFETLERRWRRALLRAMLDRCGGNQVRASERLGISRTTLRKHVEDLGL